MKKTLYILSLVTLLGCNSENAPDCFQNAGDLVQKEFVVADFTKITTFKNVELFISQGATQQVIVETGEFLINDIEVLVQNDRLLLTDNNGCNLIRDYGLTKVYVTSPNITEIRNSSQLPVNSLGVLGFETLDLISEGFTEDFNSVGDFNIEIDNTNLKTVSNNFSSFLVFGNTQNLEISYPSGNGRFEGRFLTAQNVDVFHRGTNDIIVNPQQSLTANLISTGDVIVVNTPPIIDIQEQFTGRVLFE